MNSTPPDKILIVDDTSANIALLTEILEPRGYQIFAAADGERALKIARHIIPDLILLDIMMPGIDGFETCRRLKNGDDTKTIPIIFISAKTDIDDLLMGFAVGGVDYINKPFHDKEVCARIKSQMEIQTLNRKLAVSEQDMRQVLINYQYQTERLQQIVKLVVDGILETSSSGAIQFVNPAVERLFGYTAEELQAVNFTQLLAEPFASQYQQLIKNNSLISNQAGEDEHVFCAENIDDIMGKRKNGSLFPIEFSFIKIPSIKNTYLAVIHDITMYKDKEEKLRNLSYMDPLTNLANRRHFDECFTREWLQGQRKKQQIAFIMIDIDFFKQFNDTYGHQAGDVCLVDIAAEIKNTIKRPGDIVARLGGEEFAIILPDTSKVGTIKIAEQLRKDIQALKIPHSKSNYRVVTVSLGIAFTISNAHCNSPETLYQMADKALYQAKQSGRNQYAVYSVTGS